MCLIVEDHQAPIGGIIVQIAQDASGKCLGTFRTFIDYGIGFTPFDMFRFWGEKMPVGDKDLSAL